VDQIEPGESCSDDDHVVVEVMYVGHLSPLHEPS
jgi:hypothetical protein